jgi:hypothetical protein
MSKRINKVSYELCEFAYSILTSDVGMSHEAFGVLEQLRSVSGDSLLGKMLGLASLEVVGDKKFYIIPEKHRWDDFSEFLQHTFRECFTRGTAPEETIAERLPVRYHLTIIRGDMLNLLKILNPNSDKSEELLDWGDDMRSCILENIGIEEV